MDETSSELRASVEPAHDGHSRFLSSPSLRDTGHGVGANAHGGSYRGEILSDNGGTAAGNKGSEVLSDGGGNGCGNEGSDQSADPPASAHPDVPIHAAAVQPPDHSRWPTLLGLWATLLSQVVRWPEDGAAGSAHVWCVFNRVFHLCQANQLTTLCLSCARTCRHLGGRASVGRFHALRAAAGGFTMPFIRPR